MLALRSFARSTLGELKDALIDDADGDDEDEQEDGEALSPKPPAAPALPPPAAAGGGAPEEQRGGDSPPPTAAAAAAAATAAPILPPPLPPIGEGPIRGAAVGAAAEPAVPAAEPPEPPPPSASAVLAAAGVDGDGADVDRQKLLASFSERYDSLLEKYTELQRRYREASEVEGNVQRLQQEIAAWHSAHQAATARVETLSHENAALQARVRSLEKREVDPVEKRHLLERLAQREAEVRATSEALRQIQAVVDDGGGADGRVSELERKLQEANAALLVAQQARDEVAAKAQRAAEAEGAANARSEALQTRCDAAERELRESNAALEALLQEKGRHMDEREHLVDRRLVTSMLALYLDHQASGQRSLADQVIRQTLHVLGGEPALQDRQRIRAAAAAAKARLAEPLGDAFVDFLTREAAEDAQGNKGQPSGSAA